MKLADYKNSWNNEENLEYNNEKDTEIDIAQLIISQHAKERYAERIANKEEKLELNTYLQKHDEKIVSDIKKMIKYGELIYTGKTNGGNKLNQGQKQKLFINGSWVLIVGANDNVVITLYKKDLGLDEDFSKAYVEGLAQKLKLKQQELQDIKQNVQLENKDYSLKIKENTQKINDYKTRIKELEDANKGYESISKGNLIKVKEVEDEIMDIIDRFITITR